MKTYLDRRFVVGQQQWQQSGCQGRPADPPTADPPRPPPSVVIVNRCLEEKNEPSHSEKLWIYKHVRTTAW